MSRRRSRSRDRPIQRKDDLFASRRDRARAILGPEFEKLGNLIRNNRVVEDPLEIADDVQPSQAMTADDSLDMFMKNACKEEDLEGDEYYEQFKAAMRQNPFEAVETTDGLDLEIVKPVDPDDISKLDYFQLAARFGLKKQLAVIDHESAEYLEIVKNLYVQVREITDLQDHEVQRIRELHGSIKVRGKQAPRPIVSFAQCGLKDNVRKYLESQKDITSPFPIQMQAIPALMVGRDVIGIAQTGSGKTLAYMLPLLRHAAAQPVLEHGDGPKALVIAPTRELVLQIYKQSLRLAELYDLRMTCVFGGGSLGEQLNKLKGQVEVLIATPGRLMDVLTASGGKVTNVRRVSFIVLDEADRMFDLGFEPQLASLFKTCNPKAQKCLFSATFPPHVEALARKVLVKPLEISVGAVGGAAGNITQSVEVLRSEQDKFLRLLQLLGEWSDHGSIIIFLNSQEEVDSVFARLHGNGYSCLTLHGAQDQSDRDYALKEFLKRKPPSNILLATSLASRGLDCPDCILVINYNAPDHYEDYVHRVGRTGRAGRVGWAYTFLTPQEADRAQDLIDALKSAGQTPGQSVQDLARGFAAQVASGLKVQRKKWSGFSGHGYKFDSTEQSRLQTSKILALQDDVPPPPPPPGPPPVQSAHAPPPLQIVGKQPPPPPQRPPQPSQPNPTFTEELEINEYPAVARIRISSQDARAGIEARTGCKLSIKGQYISKDHKVPEGVRKLYIEIVGNTRSSTRLAKQEAYQMVEETAIQTLNIPSKR